MTHNSEHDVLALIDEAEAIAMRDPDPVERLRLMRLISLRTTDRRPEVERLTYLLARNGHSAAAIAAQVGVRENHVRRWASRWAVRNELPDVWRRRRIDGPIRYVGYQPGSAVSE